MSENPFASPTYSEPAIDAVDSSNELANRSTRLAASIADGIVIAIIVLPIQVMTGYFERAQAQQVTLFEQLGMSVFGMFVMLVVNGYLLHTRGQSVGKLLGKIQIVDNDTSELLGIFHVFVLRYMWSLPFAILVALIPGQTDDIIMSVVVLIDILLIFGADRRCLHDMIAGTKVVMYQPGRARKA